jgi:tetratricopeptide (TPR) repeat protein
LGASGSGKSSVVLAGLVPELQRAGHWQFTHFRPGTDPFHALALALVPLYVSNLDETERIRQARNLAGYFRTGEVLLADVFAQIQQNFPTDRVLLIADQFEELYTLCTDENTRRNFLDRLLAGIAAPANRSPFAPVLIATMRADFLGNALSYRPFADVLQNADLKLGPMNRAELTEAIEQPAQKLGVTFEAGLVERILTDVEEEPGILPLLEFALTELWQRRSGKQLTHAGYEAIGQVQGALGRHANQEYAKFKDEADRERVRRILIQLVRPGEGAEDTRRIATKAELGEQNWSLVKQLADARLVVTSRNGVDRETVEVVHEALIRNWGELRGWMNTDRVFRAWQERLRGAMRQWQETKEDVGSLLRGAALAEAEEQLRERPEELVAESDFIEQSLQERERIDQAEAAQQERIKQAEAARQKRETTIARGIVAGLLVVMALGIGTIATLVSKSLLYNQYAYCPEKKGRPGTKIEDTCFRQLKTSGDVGVFLSSTNFYLDKGTDAFKKNDFAKAIKLFEQAVDSDRSDPIPRIFLNNARARLRNKPPLKLAVVTSIDYYETAAKDVLRGAADAQNEFYKNTAETDPLIELVIANDENKEKAAKKVAQELVNDRDILGIIGHHSSESTI